MKIRVHMLAFGKPGEIREVEIPSDCKNTEDLLLDVYHFGQNDFQPQQHPSVSVGDVIEYNGELHMVAVVGFRKMSQAEIKDYTALPQRDRMLVSYVR